MSAKDHRVLLCLSCSSSPSPASKNEAPPFMTSCCARPICATCLRRTPRLRDYTPCLACLVGVSAVSTSNASGTRSTPATAQKVREDAMFVLGDSDDDDDDEEPPAYNDVVGTSPSPLALASSTSTGQSRVGDDGQDNVAVAASPGPPRYHIQRNDTLQGIAFKFGVSGVELCKMNNLPLSTLSTTPHVLHTRRTLNLPSNARNINTHGQASNPDEDARRQRERAEKRFQFVTKEVDWRVARAYVALAEDEDEDANLNLAREDKKLPSSSQPLESRAVGHYLDDEEWEMRCGSNKSSASRFPLKS